ncbi:hypothetical protein HOP50_17g80660 [Chloropicon primus]|uniref:Uncharacterized protein n=1 Tax=Chloropicon primus TaxID=1764295 RepID=A0A5B8N1A4_9CHLO|nr:hypothetical protein A3770_17p80420 [Chloropicon primus]UPR04721.1 hypothetical protein HOP50_17g80660 [Chloropicon primus]|mmetsp:Transcript_11483/g.31879  ORF Transcript_11483/g.31879 Transcript_11483/m.31879 type:complete len:221 (+) Transcript_11483:164-826(+)|eukprot:QDZ25524.1 hypothetical protein A3770_17p80420 [Chloropicon primus]
MMMMKTTRLLVLLIAVALTIGRVVVADVLESEEPPKEWDNMASAMAAGDSTSTTESAQAEAVAKVTTMADVECVGWDCMSMSGSMSGALADDFHENMAEADSVAMAATAIEKGEVTVNIAGIFEDVAVVGDSALATAESDAEADAYAWRRKDRPIPSPPEPPTPPHPPHPPHPHPPPTPYIPPIPFPPRPTPPDNPSDVPPTPSPPSPFPPNSGLEPLSC